MERGLERMKGFSICGLVLGIIAAICGGCAVVFSAIGLWRFPGYPWATSGDTIPEVIFFMDRRNEQKPTEPMKNPLGSSYPVDVLAQLQSDAQSRRVFNAMPRAIQLDILQHNTMTPEALRHFYNAEQPRPSPITALLGEDENSQVYLRTASDRVKREVWRQKFQPKGGD